MRYASLMKRDFSPTPTGPHEVTGKAVLGFSLGSCIVPCIGSNLP